MAWNESGNGRNPWDRGSGERKGRSDLDRILKDWQQRLGSLLGGGRGKATPGQTGTGLAGLAVLLLFGWAATGLYRVDDAERAVILRFGQYERTSLPGLHVHFPWPIERHEIVNVMEVVSPPSQQTKMLTADENIVVVELVVQYQRRDPVKFLFNVRDAQSTLLDVSESAIRQVIGKSKMDYALGEGRAEIADRTTALIQQTLDEYGTGIHVTKVNLQDVNFPDQVETAVQDAIKAREDKERLSFEAQTYANDIVPKARGQAARQLADAEAYKARVTANAQGEASRFMQLLSEYERSPVVTRQRLYIDAVEDVLQRSNKVLVDTSTSGNVLYLPIDKLLENRPGGATPPGATRSGPATPSVENEAENAARSREENRVRVGRQ
jgi:membrane protease subunit HflK